MNYSELTDYEKEIVLTIDNTEPLYKEMKRSLFSLSTTIKEKNVGILLERFNLISEEKENLIDYYISLNLEEY